MAMDLKSWTFPIILLIGLGSYIDTVIAPPPHAQMYVNADEKVYVSVPCAANYPEKYANRKFTRALTKDIPSDFKPSRECREASGFNQEGRTLNGKILEAIGFLGPLRSRWNADGTWNW